MARERKQLTEHIGYAACCIEGRTKARFRGTPGASMVQHLSAGRPVPGHAPR